MSSDALLLALLAALAAVGVLVTVSAWTSPPPAGEALIARLPTSLVTKVTSTLR